MNLASRIAAAAVALLPGVAMASETAAATETPAMVGVMTVLGVLMLAFGIFRMRDRHDDATWWFIGATGFSTAATTIWMGAQPML